MALVTICVTAIGTLIIERVARKIYSEIKERYESRIEDRKNGFAYGKYLDGGCSSPVAAFAEVDGDEIFIRGLYYSEATGKWLTGQIRGAAEDGEKLGTALAKQLKSDCEGR